MKDALLASLIDELATVEAFASALALEEHALTVVQPLELLPPVVEQKTVLIGKLAELEAARDTLLAEMGFPAGSRGIELAADGDVQIAAQWSLLRQAAQRAWNANTTNGMLIRTRMDYNQRALAALQVVVPEKPAFYGPDGRIPAYGV
ncbi:flagella synthesis protein FlgN [Paraburkholderia megapolitana]|uniref:Flagella synthesis protein FlgN n=1 Tax=Paraburkholderia megapolitana TaxID=420953 RepID=A0A1I3SI28_9BURK|nr:flagellar protein FlgN [Paraburkholderia megapolitana]QDQ85730.1 flagellar protein FlgN [Paraburkholderia megapolitana]SFJ57301.1 flagella synthesis protein FlgN [Paraburkholderia megapolitana]